MKLTVLTENTASGKFKAEHGLSYYIEHDIPLLFDTGHTDVFLKNAEMLNIDLQKVENVVLSHGHWDHGDGLRYLKNKNLICHPYAFIKRYRKLDHQYIGLNLCYSDLNRKFKLINTRKPYKLTESIIFLGEIPRINSFESQVTPFVDEHDSDDFVPDDSALAIIQNEELIVISGCAHSGICNIIEYAKEISGIKKVLAVVGGFHLQEVDEQTKKTIKYFKKEKIKYVYPSHCTGLPALSSFYETFKIKQLKTGMNINF
jgi:7,8-dihydropterin-6-yl-methyl-4-(beta-D-ribofuranosyl)aminobenzene 5'-phosphate synthase